MKNRILSSLFLPLFLTSLFPLLLTFLTLFSGSVATAQIPSSGLVGYWPFNGNANDASGNGNNGTVNGVTLTTDRFGNPNSAYYFDGSVSTKISVDLTNTIQGTKTFSVWLKYPVNFINPYSHIITLENAGNVGVGNEYLSINGNHPFYVSANTVGKFYDGKTGLPSLNFLNDNIWHNLILIHDYDNSQSRLYIDGIFQGSANSSNFTNNPIISHLTFGSVQSNVNWANSTVLGTLDDISIYNRALTPTEITQLYTDPSVELPPCPTLATNLQTGLVGYWPFCGNANDESGNGNNGTVNGTVASLCLDRNGNINSAYNFQNALGGITVNSFDFPDENYTVSAWVNVTLDPAAISSKNIISHDWNNGGEMILVLNQPTSQSVNFDCKPNTGNALPAPVNSNVWNHFVMQRQGLIFRLFLNGVLIQEGNKSSTPIIPNNNLFFGGDPVGSQYSLFNGKIDDVSIWDRVLSPTEITQLYTDPSVTPPVACTPFLGEDQTVCAGTSVTLSASSTSSSTACPTLPSNLQTGLVGYWPFCGNANDASGNGNNGTVNGATLTTDRFGNANSAYSFDGVNDVISVPNSPVFSIFGSNQPSTISFWAKRNNNSDGYVICKGLHTPGCNLGNKYFNILWVSTNGLLYNLYNSSTMTSVQSGNAFDLLSSWQHITIVRNSETKLYIDGVDVSMNSNNSGWGVDYNSSVLTDLTFGAKNNVSANCASYYYDYFFNGYLDEITIHNRALSLSEIQQLYTLGQSTYLWSTGATTASISVTPTQTTTYTCTVTDVNGNACTDSVTVFVPQIEATDLTLCAGESTTLSVSGINSTATTTACPTLPSNLQAGLVGYWPFCGNANDASGNGNNGTVNGATLTTDRFGNVNSAYGFDGNDFVEVPSTPSLNCNNALSINAWILSTSASGSEVAVSKERHPGGTSYNLAKESGGYALGINNQPFGGNCNSACNLGASSAGSVLSNNWQYVTGVWDGQTCKLYLNGTLVSTATGALSNGGLLVSSTLPVFFGKWMQSYDPSWGFRYFNGKIDDIAIHNRALTPSEIQQLYTFGQTTYLWSNGATTPTINVSPTATTTYTCTVTTNGVSCSDAITVVADTPTATITAATATTFCQGGSVVLNANTGTGLSYQWKLNGTNITGATTSTYTANASGSYTVVVTNSSACSSTSTATVVTVNALPTATITAATATTFCQGGSVVLNANTGTGLTYQWKLNGTNITGATSSSYSANASGSYTVVVTNASTCSSTSTATVVTVNALPTATITAATATTFCQGGSVVLNANTGTGLTYQWFNNATAITGATSASYTANASGSYSVTVTNASACSSTSTATVVTVNALPTATNTAATATTFCQGGSVFLNANTGTGLTYQWFNNATAISGATSASYTATTSGSYTVTVTNASTCSSTSTATVVTVNALPIATITAATATTFCQGGSVVLNENTGTGLTYQWKLNGTNITGATSSSYTANASGSYTVVVTNASTCSSTSTAVDVTAVPNVNYFADADGDGFGDVTTLISTCVQPQGYVTDNTDCKDNDASIYPGAQEVCNDVDDDCNDLIDDGLVFMTYYADADGDSFGDVNNPLDACLLPDGYVTNNTDCNDSNANQNAASPEICNGEDDDCDGTIDNGLIFLDYYADLDSDGFGAGGATNSCVDLGAGYVTNNTDCNDNNVNQNAASTEICNGEDDDCDGAIDNGLIFLDYYADLDSDGFGAGAATNSCVDLGAGYVTNNTDCNNANANINPNVTEICNTIDDNCDGQADEGVQTVYFIDNDGDTYGNPSVSILACTQPVGYTPDDTDCNDTDASINPGAEDLGGNGIDENCDGEIDNSLVELNASINLYPNPTRSELNIQISNALVGNEMYIFDAVGKLVYKQQLFSTQTTLSMSDYANGNYIFRIGEVVKRFEVMK